MSKEYFSHDLDSCNDPELSAMVGEFKAAGYGVYWRTVEMLHKEGGYLPLSMVTFVAIARSIESSPDFVKNVIERSISDYKLFFEKKEKFSSKRVLENLKKRVLEKKNKSLAGKASAAVRWGVTPVKQPLEPVEQNVTNKRKGNKRKGKEIEESAPAKHWNLKPGAESLNLELPDLKCNAVVELFAISKNMKVSPAQVQGLWKIFKHQNFNGEKYYASASQAHSHFINWCKSQTVKDIPAETKEDSSISIGEQKAREILEM